MISKDNVDKNTATVQLPVKNSVGKDDSVGGNCDLSELKVDQILIQAIDSGCLFNLNSLRAFALHGVDFKYKDSKGNSLLILTIMNLRKIRHDEPRKLQAVIRERKQCIEFLLEKGVDINEVNFSGNTALSIAVTMSDLALVRLLLSRNADPNKTSGCSVDPPLIVALSLPNECASSIALELLNSGADVNELDKHNNTPLIVATSTGKVSCVKALLFRGANVFCINELGFSALQIARKNAANDRCSGAEILDILQRHLGKKENFEQRGSPRSFMHLQEFHNSLVPLSSYSFKEEGVMYPVVRVVYLPVW